MKVCPRCSLEKTNTLFFKNKNKKDGLSSFCRECQRIYQNDWYKSHQKEQRARVSKNSKKYKDINQQGVYQYLLTHPCIICGEKDPIVLEFDHLNPEEKEATISVMSSSGISWERVKKEIDKCQILCANCHRRKTAKQFNWNNKNAPIAYSAEHPTLNRDVTGS